MARRPLLPLLIGAAVVPAFGRDVGDKNGREIHWQDFCDSDVVSEYRSRIKARLSGMSNAYEHHEAKIPKYGEQAGKSGGSLFDV